MKVIIPCCGSSSRFPDLPPKWMLPNHSGRPMIAEAISLLDVMPSNVIVTALAEHETKFQIVRGLKQALGDEVTVILLPEKTRSQSETVARTLEYTKLNEPFLVKDSDNCFRIETMESDCNYVCYDSLNNHSLINPRNKSYLQLDSQKTLINIKEKQVISDTFSVGGYYFSNAGQFLETYSTLSSLTSVEKGELYLSDIILAMLLKGIPFKGNPVTAYQDWGTVHDWKTFLLSKKTFFVALDGYLFERGSEFFEPTFETAEAYGDSLNNILRLIEQGHTVIFLSTRPSKYAEVTHRRLAELGLGSLTVLYDCPLSKWDLITAPHRGLDFRTCDSHELDPLAHPSLDRLLQ